jgi:hypothetical protein
MDARSLERAWKERRNLSGVKLGKFYATAEREDIFDK